jgi:hypothetical protein
MRETPARQKIRTALRALGYEARAIEWNGPWVPVDFGSDGGFSIDGFGSFSSADDFIQWVREPHNLATLRADTLDFVAPATPARPEEGTDR